MVRIKGRGIAIIGIDANGVKATDVHSSRPAPGEPRMSSRLCEGPWAVRGCTPLGLTFSARPGKRLTHAISVEISRIYWRSGLLAPRPVQAAGVDAIETQFVNDSQYDSFG